MEIQIFDLYGNKLSNDSLFIIIEIIDVSNVNNYFNILCNYITKENIYGYILNYKKDKIKDILKKNNLNYDIFNCSSQIYYENNKFIPKKILLINKKILNKPDYIEEIFSIDDYFIYKPVSKNTNYTNLGLFYLKNDKDLEDIYVIERKYIKKYINNTINKLSYNKLNIMSEERNKRNIKIELHNNDCLKLNEDQKWFMNNPIPIKKKIIFKESKNPWYSKYSKYSKTDTNIYSKIPKIKNKKMDYRNIYIVVIISILIFSYFYKKII